MTVHSPTQFFARQNQARKSCRRLSIAFVIAVLLIVGIATMALRFIWYLYVGTQSHTLYNQAEAQLYQQKLSNFSLFDPASFFLAAIIIFAVVLAASFYKMHQLEKGGGVLAESLGGRLVGARPTDPDERRLVNVVEEMAIASGVPVPLVFVLDQERGINAFAAGITPQDAAVAVTRGALTKLTRDELQGVIAHEFSHILNGDMRFNLQAIGILYGILFLGIVGRQMVKRGRYTIRLGFAAVIGGFLLTVIGYIGTFMGKLLQHAISRQQETLADASAVQFTRNPGGLAGALKKIGGYLPGSRISSESARQASHLFFSESHPNPLFSFLATHPPLTARIRLLDPDFDGKYIKIKSEFDDPKPQPQYTNAYRGSLPNLPPGSPLWAAMPAMAVLDQIGQPGQKHLEAAAQIRSGVPDELDKMLSTPSGAATVIYALLMSDNPDTRRVQTDALGRSLALEGRVDNVLWMSREMTRLNRRFRLPLLELAVAPLRGLTGLEKRNFSLILDTLVKADGNMSLFELASIWILNRYLDDSAKLFSSATHFTYTHIGLDIAVILNALACAGHPREENKARLAFYEGVGRIEALAARNPAFEFSEITSYTRVSSALTRLNAASFQIKESVIDACAHCAFSDKTVTIEEEELLRIIALALECPLPPFIASTNPQNDLVA
jgi:Zn-dependent protease with chaperone function